MRMWSKGLGKMELVVDFRNYKVVAEEDEAVIKGITNEPVKWEFTARIGKDDIPGLLNIAFKPKTMFYIIKNMSRVIQFFLEKLFMRVKFKEVTLEIEKN